MAQGSSWLQQLLRESDNLWFLVAKNRTFKRRYLYRFKKSGSWFVIVVVIVAMLFSHWQLLLATIAGVLVMVVVYSLQDWDWQHYWLSLRRFFNGTNRQLTIAVGSGGLATLTTYMMVSLWLEPNTSWIAAAAMFQGFGTLAILGVVVWQMLTKQNSRDEIKQDQLLIELTDTDPLKRFLAVGNLTSWGKQTLHSPKRQQVADCFRLMLSREPEPIIRDAILDGLQVLDGHRIIGQGTQPLQIPVVMKQAEGVGSRD